MHRIERPRSNFNYERYEMIAAVQNVAYNHNSYWEILLGMGYRAHKDPAHDMQYTANKLRQRLRECTLVQQHLYDRMLGGKGWLWQPTSMSKKKQTELLMNER